jgi:circadian clock protein KaiB
MIKATSKSLDNPEVWRFSLYVAGGKASSQRALSALQRLCDHYLPNRHSIEIIDITDPSTPIPPDVLAIPTVIRLSPSPERRVIGDLSDLKKTAQGLGLMEEPFL